MEYRITFIDATSVQDDDNASRDESDEQIEVWLKDIVADRFMIPPSHIDVDAWDGAWVDFTVSFSFEAASPAEVRSEAERILDTCGRNVEVFSVTDEANNVVLTEEDRWRTERQGG